MHPGDLPDVKRISDIVHHDLTESDLVFAARLRMFPQGCFITEDGYAVGHPASLGRPPELDELHYVMPPDADALHIHDVALLPYRQRAGLGTEALRLLLAVASACGLRHSSLIAVPGKDTYWMRHGYRHAEAAHPAVVASYGDGAVYMTRTLDFR